MYCICYVFRMYLIQYSMFNVAYGMMLLLAYNCVLIAVLIAYSIAHACMRILNTVQYSTVQYR